MIQSFNCPDTRKLYEGKKSARFANIASVAERKLQQLDSAASLDFLRSSPGNRLEALSGNRAGQYRIRINAPWHLGFVWGDAGPERVEIVDYH